MSDSNAPTHLQPSSELVIWLQSLALPAWARGLPVIVWVAVMAGGPGEAQASFAATTKESA